jgi:acyl carrier protein
MTPITEQTVERQIMDLLAEICKRGVETIRINDSLVDDLGIDSIRFLEMLAELEEKFQFEMDVDDLRPELFRSVRSVIQFVKRRVMLA